jgi:hypothetical protein
MSLLNKSDVKNHLSTKSGTSVYPFGLKRSDTAPAAEGADPGAKVDTDMSISPSHPISPEAVPNTQVGGSVGVPTSAGRSGKGSW